MEYVFDYNLLRLNRYWYKNKRPPIYSENSDNSLEEFSMKNLDTFLTKNYDNFLFIKSDKLE